MSRSREEQTLRLIPALQRGDAEALRSAVELNLPLVHAMQRRIQGRQDPEETFQNGCIGLILALQKFNTDYGVCFSTYAVPYILGEMRRSQREGGSVHVSRGIRDESRKLLALQQEMIKDRGRQVTLRELSERAGTTVEEAAFLIASRQEVQSLDAPAGEDDPSVGLFVASDAQTQEEALRHLMVKEAFSHLSPREAKLIYLRYFRDHTQSETARELSVSQVQISRLEKKILAKLRAQMGAESATG